MKEWWKIVAILVTVAIAALGTMNALGVFQGEIKRDVIHNHEAIQDMQPEVKQNTEHRHRFEEKVTNIERDVGLILKKVSEQ